MIAKPGLILISLLLLGLATKVRAETLVVGYSNFPPFILETESGTPVGFSPDLIDLIAQAEGVDIEYRQFGNPGESMAALAAGQIDLVPNLAPTAEREDLGSFTQTIATTTFSLYALKGRARALTQALPDGARLGYVQSAFSAKLAAGFPGQLGVGYDTNEAMLVGLSSGDVDVALFSDFTIRQLSAVLGIRDRFEAVGDPVATIPLSVVVPRDRPALLDRIETTLDTILTGREVQALRVRWLGARPENEISAATWRRISIMGLALAAVSLLAMATVWLRARNRSLASAIARASQEAAYSARLKRLNGELQNRNLEMERLIYVVSHDLKSPLVSISGFASRAAAHMQNERSAEAERALDRVQTNVETMSALIDGILQISKVGQQPLDIQPVSMTEMGKDLETALFMDLRNAGARLEWNCALVLQTDPRILQQILQNLIANATRYGCPRPGMAIEVLGEATSNGFRIGVRDHGPGVAPEFREKIFEMYQKLASDGPGKGLGLAIVRKLVESLGGTVRLESAADRETTFWILLPTTPELSILHSEKAA